MPDDKKKPEFRTISHAQEDYDFYEQIRAEVSKKLGTRLSLAQVIKLGMTFYNQRRNFVGKDQPHVENSEKS